MKIHEKYILRCIQVAKNGLGSTFPNPMVGSVVVHDNEIIGEGFTSPFGGPHAEVNAINSVKNKALLSEATLYVTLEPCSHHGKTPPCADLIIEHNIPHVVIGLLDPHIKVAGNGIKKLQNAGCQVVVNVLENECRDHHKRFLTFHEQKRPFIILKWAETADGFLAPEQSLREEEPTPYWITNVQSRQLVHKWRSEEQAILVGTHTVLKDNPKLNVRSWHGKSPTRIIIDRNLKVGSDFHVMDGSTQTIVLTQIEHSKRYVPGIEYEVIDFSKNVALQICEVLYRHNILSVIIEGGSKTLQMFLDNDIWDEARVFKGASRFGKGLQAPMIHSLPVLKKSILTDTLFIYNNV
ncbi:bifunctional diaminohydroxyphosphoribosylaminopyrimidine deaminase/5-amino-6-(5-phosphoribosylamino)uracil reductase RibD [Sediminicola sp. 1XM1-17]|uniref:bifunctional diaminohydroxyphosphoribosylaminopyrimidine deaminase/5-amino-6-(5-phosphoribosylamino)uracil reductase RibD n=1 Tax=Sediminicola sp. 1XM1-17 TaxID=3127702 RepID=UPI00307710BB